MLHAQELEDFATGFFGYGAATARFWFVGMEEAGGGSEREIQQRIAAWRTLGSMPIVDCSEFHALVDRADGTNMTATVFEAPVKIQPTWGPLIRFFLRAQSGESVSADDVRKTQSSRWGRSDSDTCLVELLPLPSPSSNEWPYGEWTDIARFAERDAYRAALLPSRLKALSKMIREHRPRAVLFYGTSCLPQWSEIAELNFNDVELTEICLDENERPLRARVVHRNNTTYVSAYHPSYQNKSSYFEGLGDTVRVESDSAPRLMPADIAADVRKALEQARMGRGSERHYMTAYQILALLPKDLRDTLIYQRGLPGTGARVHYSAASLVSDAVERIPDVEKCYLDATNTSFKIDHRTVSAGFEVCSLYRLR